MRINVNDITRELSYAKYVCTKLRNAGYTEGDTFTHMDVDVNPMTLTHWAELGFIELDTKMLVTGVYDRGITPGEFVENLMNGKIRGSYYTRNKYKVISTDFKEFKAKYLERLAKEMDTVLNTVKKMK